jgi:hypothetical protein
MWAAWVIVAIALAATAFMLRFLIALLLESAPSVCYWLVPVRREPEKERQLQVLRGVCIEDACRMTENDSGDYRRELTENEHHAEEKCIPDLIGPSLHPGRDNVVWRTVQPSGGNVFRGRRL